MNLTALPTELIQYIGHHCWSHNDVYALQLTCRHLCSVLDSNFWKVWKPTHVAMNHKTNCEWLLAQMVSMYIRIPDFNCQRTHITQIFTPSSRYSNCNVINYVRNSETYHKIVKNNRLKIGEMNDKFGIQYWTLHTKYQKIYANGVSRPTSRHWVFYHRQGSISRVIESNTTSTTCSCYNMRGHIESYVYIQSQSTFTMRFNNGWLVEMGKKGKFGQKIGIWIEAPNRKNKQSVLKFYIYNRPEVGYIRKDYGPEGWRGGRYSGETIKLEKDEMNQLLRMMGSKMVK